MEAIIEKLRLYNVRFEMVTDTTIRMYGNFRGFSVVRNSEFGVEVDGRIKTVSEFEDWLYLIKT